MSEEKQTKEGQQEGGGNCLYINLQTSMLAHFIYSYVCLSVFHESISDLGEKPGVWSPACLWWVGVFGSCVLLPCWRKRAAPLTMKKLSLRLETTITLFCCSILKYLHLLVGKVMWITSFSVI